MPRRLVEALWALGELLSSLGPHCPSLGYLPSSGCIFYFNPHKHSTGVSTVPCLADVETEAQKVFFLLYPRQLVLALVGISVGTGNSGKKPS